MVLLCQHDTDGAFGLVLNRPVTTTARIVPQDDPDAATEQEVEVWIGGPVEPERSWILISDPALDDNAIRVCDGVYLSTSARVLQNAIAAPDQARARLIAGYAGWGPGQLDEEVAASAWLTSDISLDLVFETPADEMWERGHPAAGDRTRQPPARERRALKTTFLLSLCLAGVTTAMLPAADQAPPDEAGLDAMTARFAPVEMGVDVSALPVNERRALGKLVEAGHLMDAIFLRQVWAGNEAELLPTCSPTTRRWAGRACTTS